jgi:L-lactate dehydrogenase (cytochrome)
MAERKISINEISSHNKDTDCWIVVDGKVWDITNFAPEHPGGPGIIYKYAGRDATMAYNEIHSPGIIKNGLPAHALKGVVDAETVTEEWARPKESAPKATTELASKAEKPPLESLINAHDFEVVARNTATAKTWAFYSSAANDVYTSEMNGSLFKRILLRPRVMRKVHEISTRTRLMGYDVAFPLFVAPAAMARMIHPQGELAIARACRTRGVIQGISNNASYSAQEIVGQAEVRDYPFMFQLYVNRDRAVSEKLLAGILEHENVRGIMVTADAAVAGKREADERVKSEEMMQSPMMSRAVKSDKKGGGMGRLMGRAIDADLCWEDISWLRRHIKGLPLFVKGIMSADDVALSLQYGLDGVVLSNHGGRNLDTSPPAILVLLELHARFPEIISRHHPDSPSVKNGLTKPFSILIDGGIRRGTDIFKCICLGAVACGIGRPALFATGYGQEGVEHLFDVLKDEFEVAMKNSGVTSLDQCGPELVNTGDIDALVMKRREHPYAVSWSSLKGKL